MVFLLSFRPNIFHYYHYSLRVFHISVSWWFSRGVCDKSPHVSRILLSILADLSNTIVWMVSTRPFISKSSSPFIDPLVIVPRAPITIGINVSFMFHSFFSSLVRSRYLFFFSLSFNFTLGSAGTAKPTSLQVIFFLLIIIRSGRLAEIRRSVWMTKSQRSLCVSFAMTDVGLDIYHLFVWWNWNVLLSSQLVTLPNQSCLVLYSFRANLPHSLIM